MYICNRLPIYRLPFLMELPQSVTNLEVEAAIWKTFKNHPTLQINYYYDTSERSFFQKFVPLEDEAVNLPIMQYIKDAFDYVKRHENIIDLTKGYPWKVEVLETGNKRYLYIEFHHICIDGLGVRSFENEFLSRLFGKEGKFMSSELDSYSKVRAVKEKVEQAELLEPMGTHSLDTIGMEVSRKQRCKLDQQLVKKVAKYSQKIGVTKNIFYQSIFEKMAGNYFQGEIYGVIGNWRLSGLGFSEIGCYVRIVPEKIQKQLSITDNTKRLFSQAIGMFGQREMPKKISDYHYKVIYSYEENMFDTFEFIPVDKLCKFDFYFRIEQKVEHTCLEIEYSQKYFSEIQIKRMLIEFCRYINTYSFRKRESLNGNHQ